MDLTVLLPTYNEEGNVAKVIDQVRSVVPDAHIFVVDSNSKDRTVAIAQEKDAETLVVEKRGKGLAVKYALEKITSDYLIIMDSDLTYPAHAIPSILEKLKSCDVVVGSRFDGKIETGAMSPVNVLGNRFLTTLASLLYQKKINDVCSGMWGFTKNAYTSLFIDAPHFELEVNLFVESVKRGFRICELPISYAKRGGKSKLSIKHGLDIAAYLVKKRF